MESTSQKDPHIIGGFEIVSKLGQGAMGAVFKARQPDLDRMVALKILPPIAAAEEGLIDRFRREARVSAKLGHPHIIQGVDVGQDEKTGLWYFAMEYVDGPPLRKILKKNGPFSEKEALRITRQIAEALVCAEKHKIVHRDIKPDNILLGSDGMAKLADLGLAKQTTDKGSKASQTGNAVGTPHYMAPEQVRGQIGQIDIRTDIYALGATLYHLVTGNPPFEGDSGAVVMAKHLNNPVPLAHRVNPRVSEPCSRLIVRMMSKEKEQRVGSATELVEQIDAIILAGATRRVGFPGNRRVTKSRSKRESRGHKRISGKLGLAPRERERPRPSNQISQASESRPSEGVPRGSTSRGTAPLGPLPWYKSPIFPLVMILLLLFIGAVGYLIISKSGGKSEPNEPVRKTTTDKKNTKRKK